jgi:hypothetical protein
MGQILNWKGNLNVPNALRLGHNEARAQLVRATMASGHRVPRAAGRVAELCLPHFEHEEKKVFPILALLPYLERGDLRPEMMDAMPLITAFRENHETINANHHSLLAAIEELLRAAHKDKNREFVEFAYNLRVHERVEDEVIYPTVILIGKYLQEHLNN